MRSPSCVRPRPVVEQPQRPGPQARARRARRRRARAPSAPSSRTSGRVHRRRRRRSRRVRPRSSSTATTPAIGRGVGRRLGVDLLPAGPYAAASRCRTSIWRHRASRSAGVRRRDRCATRRPAPRVDRRRSLMRGRRCRAERAGLRGHDARPRPRRCAPTLKMLSSRIAASRAGHAGASATSAWTAGAERGEVVGRDDPTDALADPDLERLDADRLVVGVVHLARRRRRTAPAARTRTRTPAPRPTSRSP